MAEIAPFRALRFDLTREPEASALLAPPYDVIPEAEREALEARHPHNVVRLDLPRGEGDTRYAHARSLLEQWVAAGVLREDAEPAIYRYEQTFGDPRRPTGGPTYVRRGFIALLRLTPFSDRIVLPHEHTLSGPKVDREKLIRTTRAHFSQVFTLYRDPEDATGAAFAAQASLAPTIDTVTADGCRHRLWVVNDRNVIDRVAAVLASRSVMIADGHHRYETMLALRDELRPKGAAPGSSLWDWGTVFFARAEDPGLLVLPTHRLVKNLPAATLAELPSRAAPWFDVSEGDEQTITAIEARLERDGAKAVTFAFRRAAHAATLWFHLRPDADLSALGPPALRGLDVTVLHGLVLGPLLGIDAAAMASGKHLSYTHDTAVALADIEAGQVEAGFLMNATQVEQVLAACEAGFVLPQKSTYFQPKLATGLVMARLDAERGPGR